MAKRMVGLLCLILLAAGPAAAKKRGDNRPSMESLFLDFSKTQLGPISSKDAKRKYLYTIQLEKSRLSHTLLRVVYDNAFDLYRQGDFDGTRELTGKILQMDPTFEDAAILYRAASELRGSSKPLVSGRKLVESRFEEGLSLYRQGRLVEASKRWGEASKLAPGNLKVRYWLKKVRRELADEHFRRGQKAYRQHRMRDALDQWYAALLLNPKYPRLLGVISQAESDMRRQQANEKLQLALQLYGQGRTQASLKALDEVLEIAPGEPKAEKLISEIRLEIAKHHIALGRKQYRGRSYRKAIKEWNRAVDFGYDPRKVIILIARARDQMKRERDEAQARAEREKREREEAEERTRDEEERKRREEEERAKQLEATPPEVEPEVNDDDSRRRAMKHWNNGIIFFQKGDYPKARDEWLLCKQFDAKNADCQAGLQRIDNTYGGGP